MNAERRPAQVIPPRFAVSSTMRAGNVRAQFCAEGALQSNRHVFGASSDMRKHRLVAMGWLLAVWLVSGFATSATPADFYNVPALYKWYLGGGSSGGLPLPQQATDTAFEAVQNLCGIWGDRAAHLLVIPDLQGWRQTFLCVDQDGVERGHGWISQTGFCPVFPTFSLMESGDIATINNPNCPRNAAGSGCYFDDGDPAGSGYPISVDVGFVTCRVYYFNQFKTPGPSCNRVGNPIDPFTGNKYEYEVDFSAPSNSLLTFGRHYNSHSGQPFQDVWTHTFYRKITEDFFTQHSLEMYRPEGARWTFAMSGNVGTPDADINATLQRQVDANGVTGYLFTGPNDERETYDASGNIVSLKERSGRSLSFAYSNAATAPAIAPKPGLLISVTDDFGRSLHLNYNAGSKVSKLIEPDGRYVTYQYDTSNRLWSVAYPDNTSRTYAYDEAAYRGNVSLPFALTGIFDENNVRFATFRYDAYGRAIGSEHAGGADKVSITNVDFHPIVVDGKGTSIALEAQNVLGVPRVISSSIPYPYCGSGSKAAQVDARGNFISRTDFNDHKTCYAYEPVRNLETVRVEGVLTGESCATVLAAPPNRADVRWVLTSWHPTYRLPATISEPAPGGRKTTVFTYDPGTGDLLKKAITAPANDMTGNSITRTWQWTYFSFGRVHTAVDPNGKITTTSYYDNDPDIGKNGNIKTIINPLQHVTTFNTYDPNGRPLTVIDPNGLVTTLSYHPRGWLALRQVGTEPTRYGYDGVGQLTKAILPDGSYIQYTYDDAHRLTQISDGLYDKIVYTLDAMGNRIKEEVFDPNKTLTRTRQQVYDSLNRLHQSIGAL